MKDINGNIIREGQSVNVPEPINDDIHNFEFRGIIVDIMEDKETVIVEDGDSDFFEIEGSRLEII